MKLMTFFETMGMKRKARQELVTFGTGSPFGSMRDPAPVAKELEMTQESRESEALTDVDEWPRSRGPALRNLGEWIAHWEDVIASRTPLTERGVDLLVDRLLVLRFLTLRTKSSEIMGGIEGSLGHEFSVTELFSAIWRRFGIEAFRPDTILDDCEVASSVALEMCRDAVGRNKQDFTISSILESFNRGDPSEKALTRIVADDCELLGALLAKHADSGVPLMVQVDVDQLGYRTVLKAADMAIDCHEIRNTDILSNIKTKKLSVDELDLFSSAEIENEHPSVDQDVYGKVIGEILKVNCTSLRQRRIVKLLLTLKVIDRKLKFGSLTDFPTISQVFTGFQLARLKGSHQLDNGAKLWKV